MNDAVNLMRRTGFGTRAAVAVSTTLLSGWAVILVRTQTRDLLAALAVLAMVLPILAARRAPVATAGALAAATLANGLLFGHLVRCGPALPAAFYVAFVLGRRCVGWRRHAGLGGTLTGVLLQCVYDPQLGLAVIALMGPATLMFFGAGLLVRARASMVAQLRERNAQLHQQRERTAALAVAADQDRIRGELIDGLREQIHQLADTAESARAGRLPSGAALASIECTGRATLDRMRDIVGTMQSAPTTPEPGLEALGDLLNSATTSTVRLSIEGEARSLPASIELSGYRIVERLVALLEDDPAARGQVRVLFASDALELTVTGPLARDVDPTAGFTGVVDRAAIHGGTFQLAAPAEQSPGRQGRLDAHVRLPLITSHA